jgi:DNA-binding response OmpR family regulator
MSKKVILIQDDSDCKDIMRYILEEEGFEVMTPASKEVLNHTTVDFDLVIIDEYSEGKTGSNICKQLKNDDQTCNKPVLLTSTGLGLESVARDCKADTYLIKPFDITYFAEVIKTMLDRQWSVAL